MKGKVDGGSAHIEVGAAALHDVLPGLLRQSAP
jgi:hypothetical protein